MEAPQSSAHSNASYPKNPVLCRIWRGSWVESQHRGAWALVDPSGALIDGAGGLDAALFARSSIKSLQALPLLESGAAERFGFEPADVALALSSHNAEACHTERALAILSRVGLGVEHLGCGAQAPGDPEARRALEEARESPSALHNNCSGKHAGFLALAHHLGEEPERYLDAQGLTQGMVREAVGEMCGRAPAALEWAVDGCSAPTWRLSLLELATGLARVGNPDGLTPERRAACRSMTTAAAAHPELIAGRHRRLCTDLLRVSGGRLFPKIGAEGVYVIGVCEGRMGLAVKIDDGGRRALHAVVLALLERFELLGREELEGLSAWSGAELKNWAGREVGRVEALA